MGILLIILWLLAGAIAVWRVHFGILKEWYEEFGSDHREWCKENGYIPNTTRILFLSPVFVVGGFLSLFLFQSYMPSAWYFNFKTK